MLDLITSVFHSRFFFFALSCDSVISDPLCNYVGETERFHFSMKIFQTQRSKKLSKQPKFTLKNTLKMSIAILIRVFCILEIIFT